MKIIYNAKTGETVKVPLTAEEIAEIEQEIEEVVIEPTPTLEDRVVTIEETLDVLFGGGE